MRRACAALPRCKLSLSQTLRALTTRTARLPRQPVDVSGMVRSARAAAGTVSACGSGRIKGDMVAIRGAGRHICLAIVVMAALLFETVQGIPSAHADNITVSGDAGRTSYDGNEAALSPANVSA